MLKFFVFLILIFFNGFLTISCAQFVDRHALGIPNYMPNLNEMALNEGGGLNQFLSDSPQIELTNLPASVARPSNPLFSSTVFILNQNIL